MIFKLEKKKEIRENQKKEEKSEISLTIKKIHNEEIFHLTKKKKERKKWIGKITQSFKNV